MRTHDFGASLKQAEIDEKRLDDFYGKTYTVVQVPMSLQQLGIDRLFFDGTGVSSVEYKCCRRAVDTGNAFIELLSNDASGKLGWLYTTNADWLLYFNVGSGLVLWLLPSTLRNMSSEWVQTFPLKPSKNQAYNGIGVVVKIETLEKTALRKDLIP